MAALADVIHVPADLGRHPSLRAAIAVLGEELASAGILRMELAGLEPATSWVRSSLRRSPVASLGR